MKLATRPPETDARRQHGSAGDHLNFDPRGRKATNERDQQVEEIEQFDPATLSMPVGQLVLFTRQMSMLLTSGSGLVPAINAIAPQMKSPKHRRMLEEIRNDLEEGTALTDALAQYPRAFDASYCAVVAAGESSARLPAMFSRLAVILGKRRAMRNRIVGSLIYPALLIVMSVKILAVMLFFVIPRFAGMFTTLGVEIPASTRVLMTTANICRNHWYLFVLAVLGVIGALYYAIRTDSGRQFMSNIQIRIPIVGRLMSRLIQAQTFRILGMLLEARVGLLEGLELARKVTRNDRFQLLYNEMRDAVTRGESVSGSLKTGVAISPSIIQAIRTGEQSGRLGDAISYVADVLDEENSELLNATTKLIEPLVLIVMGVIVGFVAVSLFMPLFDMTAAM
ncbi:MAG: type II secretion system F family protein [Phycisphaerales bacterium]|nr:type II secretion system F family protein [Phycisphaerales bacterium]